MLNQQWLHTFLTLVEIGHFTRTAEKLFMTQPGVSQHIKKLEQQVGTPLLVRTGKRFELTPTGQLLVEHGHTLRAQETAFFEALDRDDPFRGSCHLACSGAMALRLYPALLTYQQQHPALVISLEAAPNSRIVAGILDDQFDLGITTQASHAQRLNEMVVGYESLCLVLPADFDDSQGINLQQLQSLGFINHPDGTQYAEQLLGKNFRHHFKGISSLQQKGYINQISQILLPVASGLGFTVIQESVARQFSDPSAIKIAQLAETVQEPLYLISKRYRPLAARQSALVKQIKQLLL